VQAVWLGYCLGCASMPNSATVPVSIATLLPRTSIHRHMNQPDREECQKEQANEGAKEIRGKRGRVFNFVLICIVGFADFKACQEHAHIRVENNLFHV